MPPPQKDTAIVLDDSAAASVDSGLRRCRTDPPGGDEPPAEQLYNIPTMADRDRRDAGTMLEMIDTSIINDPCRYAGSFRPASRDHLGPDSYLLANGIMIPMTGWISSRFGASAIS